MHFPDILKVNVNREEKKVRLSIRTTESKVEIHEFDLSDFKVMVDNYKAQLK